MAFKIFGRKKSPETAENCSFPIEERAETKVSEGGSGAELLAAALSGCRVTADTADECQVSPLSKRPVTLQDA